MDLLIAVRRTRTKIPAADPQRHVEPYGSHNRASHCRWLLDQIEFAALSAQSELARWPAEYPPDRCHRWLGWVQGVMYSEGWATIAELREINQGAQRAEEAVESQR